MNDDPGRQHAWRLCFFPAIVALFALAFGTSAAFARDKAQEKKADIRKDYALIFGTVWDKDSRPVYGVTVKIRRADQKKAKWELTSDHNGEFAQRVPAGAADYVVWAELPKHKGRVAETKVHIDNDERTDIGLHLTE
jgi:hypothetical protein